MGNAKEVSAGTSAQELLRQAAQALHAVADAIASLSEELREDSKLTQSLLAREAPIISSQNGAVQEMVSERAGQDSKSGLGNSNASAPAALISREEAHNFLVEVVKKQKRVPDEIFLAAKARATLGVDANASVAMQAKAFTDKPKEWKTFSDEEVLETFTIVREFLKKELSGVSK